MPSQPTEGIPAPSPVRRRRSLRWGRLLHNAIHAAWSLLLVAAAAILWVWILGVPGPIKNRILARLRGDGYEVQVGDVHLDPRFGFTLHDVRMSGPAPLGDSFLRAERVNAAVRWKDLVQGHPALGRLEIRAASLDWPYQVSGGSTGVWSTSGLSFDLQTTTGEVQIEVREGLSAGVRIDGGARVRGPISRPQRALSWQWITDLSARSAAAPSWIDPIRQEIADVRMGDPPRLTVQFDAELGTSSAVRVSWQAAGTRTYVRKGVLDSWSCAGAYDGADFIVSNLTLRAEQGSANAAACWHPAAATLDLQAASDLPAGHTLALLPAVVRGRLLAFGLSRVDGLRLALSASNAPLSSWARQLAGTVAADALTWHDIPIRSVSASYRTSAEGLRIDPLRGIVGKGPGEGPVAGSWAGDWSNRYSAALQLGFDPHLALPLLTPNQSNLVMRFTFPEHPPQADVQVSGHAVAGGEVSLAGTITASNFSYNSVTAAQFSTSLVYSNELLTFRDWRLHRPEGALVGSLAFDLRAHEEEVDMASTIDAEALKKVIGPAFVHNLRMTNFRGPAAISARGRVGQVPSETRLQVDIESVDTALEWFRCERVSLQLGIDGETFRFSNVVARAYGGGLTGLVTLVISTNAPPTYEISAGVTGLALRTMLLDLRPGDTGLPHGALSGVIKLSGVAGPGEGTNVTGRGSLTVADGQLFRLKVLGGLSSLLSAIVPGLGYASQTDFKSDFVIKRGRVETTDAMLEGSVISIRITGAYYFDQRVKFVVEVKPLRSGSVATVLRWLTAPVTKLFKFSLSGTMADPKWRPSNLPDSLFLIFD